ncbi:uncharacterized protein BDR25DRAFT_100282 [Lindgomyces ingoldianus]|uniref:Uncharacterized protein n=1 Tax=Lindgomyces ingoldianus TaxID=673940 RepID=A0ACB6R7B9_9PLEO|nr:uncharacterized protein BDR25DRAFT_100282 [Lindgomyces ingoldianus]KAF2475149.1 hypothetical protein BDR25DRAFT_100282 [Lindgomyces ingoldianus]
MRNKLLNCLPSMRWVPHDIPATASTSQAQSSSRTHRSRFSRKATKDHESSIAPPLHHRKSTLSITSVPDPELDARTHVQAQSPFFKKLPIEIRMMVYELVMGEEVVHLTLGSKGRLGHFVCEDEGKEEEVLGQECGCRVLVGGRDCRRLERWRVRFLRVCRRVYSEAISILYKAHPFSLLHSTHLLYLPTHLPSPRLNNIRILRLRWAIRALPYFRRPHSKKIAYPEDTLNWQRGWHIIASMKGLRELFVVLADPSPFKMWEQKWIELEKELLAPVKLVIQPRWFELWLPYSGSNVGLDMGGSSCRLRKPDGLEEGEEED